MGLDRSAGFQRLSQKSTRCRYREPSTRAPEGDVTSDADATGDLDAAPESICGVKTQACCGDQIAFRAYRDRGTYTCEDFHGATLVDDEDCVL